MNQAALRSVLPVMDSRLTSRPFCLARRRVSTLAWLLALLGCQHAAGPSATSNVASIAAPTTAAAAPIASGDAAEGAPTPAALSPSESTLRRLSQAWARDPDLMQSGHHPTDDLARCPRARHDARADTSALVPPSFVRFEGIATRACDAVLWVFLGCTAAVDDAGTSCDSWSERLVLEPVGTRAAHVVGNVELIKGANAGGLYVPFAFARGDRWILLRAWMFPPGAGGGAVDYGVGVIARATRTETAPIHVDPFPVRDPVFYADFGCAIGLAASDKTPSYAQPGFPSNNGGALVAVDLATLQPHTLLEEPDTTYSIDRVDERAGTLDVEVKRHTFGKDCPRQEDALSCSASTSAKRRLALPACATAQ
jgi:hypothetical protein